MKTLTGLAAALALTAGAAAAEPGELDMADFDARTVQNLVDLCSADGGTELGSYAVGYCFGFFEGARQFYHEMLEDPRFDVQPLACPNRSVTRDESRVIFLEWAADNPSLAGEEALHGAILAAKAKFPC